MQDLQRGLLGETVPWGQLGGPATFCQGRPSPGSGLHPLAFSLTPSLAAFLSESLAR